MDQQSIEIMKAFVRDYTSKINCPNILDVGSLDVNGTYRDLFPYPFYNYIGLDVVPGRNVDIVTKDPYHYIFPANFWDVIISGQCLEHVEDIYAWSDEAIRILKPGGLMCIIVPNTWVEHKYPIDCWRFFPDGLRWLFVKRTKLMQEIAIATQGPLTIAVLRKLLL